MVILKPLLVAVVEIKIDCLRARVLGGTCANLTLGRLEIVSRSTLDAPLCRKKKPKNLGIPDSRALVDSGPSLDGL